MLHQHRFDAMSSDLSAILSRWCSTSTQRQRGGSATGAGPGPSPRALTRLTYNRMVVSMDAAFQADLIFGALSDATRRDIVRRAVAGEEGVAELALHYPMSFAAVQKHVAVLERAGLIGKERTGRRKVVRTQLETVRRAQRVLDEFEELWRGRIDRMVDLIAEDKEAQA